MKQVIDFIKTHTVALACALVAVIAIIAYFVYPIPSYFGDLQTRVEARKATNDTIDGLLRADRTLPVTDPRAPEPAKLTIFPTRTVIKQGQDALALVADQARRVLQAAIELNARKPLVEGALPRPSPLARQQFFDAYRRETAQTGEAAQNGIIRRILQGALPPTQEEIAALDQARTNEIIRNELQTDARGNPQNQPHVDAAIAAMRARLPQQQRLFRAQNSQVYVSPGAVETHPGLAGPELPDATTIFNAQFSLWLQQIAMEAIADANEGSKMVFDSPVKHLLSLRVPMSMVDPGAVSGGGFGFGAPAGDAAPAAAPELKPDASAAITPSYATDPLGYTHNSMFDPIRFEMTLRVDVRRLPQVLATISRDHFIKVRNVNLRTVDAGTALAQGFYYDRDGKTPLVDVVLDCDVLILREWLVRYMPDPVKAFFSNLSNPVAPAGA